MNKKGFTLIELLAVIIILGILMIIAIPSVTKYISDSRKSAYIDTAKELVVGARNVVNEGKLEMYSTDTTYYIPSSCIKTENGGEAESPYGKFKQAYIGVIYNGQGYKYYWISVDESGQGIKDITPLDKLDVDDIESDLKSEDIKNTVETTGIGNRSEIKILDCSTNSWDRQYHLDNTSNNASEEYGGASSGGSGSESNNGLSCNGFGTDISSDTVCKAVKNISELRTKTCDSQSFNGCSQKIGIGETITYGTIVNGCPKPGDAFDCKVTIDGEYTERFYYVGSSGDNAILIYYKNMNNQTMYAYDSSKNWYGPRKAYNYLPSTSVWNNPNLIEPGTRNLLTEIDTTSTSGGTLEPFTYTNKAARFLTVQEVKTACNVGDAELLDECNWLMDSIGYYEGTSGTKGYWLETPRSGLDNMAYGIRGDYRLVFASRVGSTATFGVRPVITVQSSNISN